MISLLNEYKAIDKSSWDSLLKYSKTSSVFQSSECYAFYDSLSFIEPFVYGVTEAGELKGVVMGYIQKERKPIIGYLSRRAIVPGGALLSDTISDDAVQQLMTFVKEHLRKQVIYIEIRNYTDYSNYKSVFKFSGFEYREHLNFKIDTSTLDIIKTNLGNSRKRDIRTTLREGVEVVGEFDEQDLKAYYQLLHQLYKERIKTPLFPYEFFEKLHKTSFGKIVLLWHQGVIICGTVFAALKDRILYYWFVFCEDGKIKHVYPSTLATYAGMEYAMNHGMSCFDMMGAGKPNEGYGVRDFKAKFGGKLVQEGRFIAICNPLLYKIGELGIKYLKGKR